MMKSITPLYTRIRSHVLIRPAMFQHHESESDTITTGQKVAEASAARIGSWPFLIGQSAFLASWIVFNLIGFTHHFDPAPFILLNLMLSFQAAFTGPILLIAANVAALRDHRQFAHIEQMVGQIGTVATQIGTVLTNVLSIVRTLGYIGRRITSLENQNRVIITDHEAVKADLSEIISILKASHADKPRATPKTHTG